MGHVELASKIDHTLLGPDISQDRVRALCKEATKYGFKSVCVNPNYVSLAKEELRESEVKVCTVIGFPHGANSREVKAFEAREAVDDGADELDMVLNLSALKAKDYRTVLEEIVAVREAVGDEMGVKASGGIRDYETAVRMLEAGADRIGTSSGVEIIEGAPE